MSKALLGYKNQMKPRLKTSSKWTAFPAELTLQIAQIFKQNFGSQLPKAQFIVEGQIYPREILLRVGYIEPGRLAQNNFEVSLEYAVAEGENAVSAIHLCVDAAGSLLQEFIEGTSASSNEAENETEFDLPRTWTEYPFQGKKIFLQYTTVNTNLEAQADALLGETADDSLVKEEEADEEENSGPQMFSKKKKSQLH